MSISRRAGFLLLLAGAALVPARADVDLRVAAPRSRAARRAFRDGEVIVGFHRDADTSLVSRAIRDAGGVAARHSRVTDHYLVELERDADVSDAVARLRGMPEVDFAEPNGVLSASLSPNDKYYSLEWNLDLIHAPRTWDIQTGDPSVVVAVVDSGVAFEDFGPFRKAPDWGATRFVTGYNAYDGSSHANDDNFHGTHVASTVAEATNNGVGAAGIAFNAAIMPVKVLDSNGEGDFFTVAEGITWAADHGAKVINLSLGAPAGIASEDVRRAIAHAVSLDVVVVAAAGNESGPVGFPANIPSVIAVGAVDLHKNLAYYSDSGPEISVVAPGGDVTVDDNNDGFGDGVLQQTFDPDIAAREHRYDEFHYFFLQGTSMAAPHVSALAALLIRQGITDAASVRAAIENTAEDLGPTGKDSTYGHGLIRPDVALSGYGINQ